MVCPASIRLNFCIRKLIFVTLELVFLLGVCCADEGPQEAEFCAMEASVELTNASRNASGFLDESGYFFPPEATRLRAGVRHGCICDVKPCLAHCPRKNEARNGVPRVTEDAAKYTAIPRVYATDLTLDDDGIDPEKWFHVVKWDPCKEGLGHLLDPKNYPGDKFYLLKNGSLFIPGRDEPEARFKDFRTSCLRLEGNDSTYTPKICAQKRPATEDSFNVVSYVGGLVSVPFLIATVIVYSVLPELRNIHGTTLRCYLCCLIVTYLALGASRLIAPYYRVAVRCFAFTSWFSFVSSFFWLNVMSFDIWWNLGGFGFPQRSCANDDRRKFVYYSIYAWGVGLVLTAICIGTELSPNPPGSIGLISADVVYFTVPVGLTIACNICLFVSTTLKVIQHNKRMRNQLTNEDSRCHDDHKHWFNLHLKLFVLMGITWSTEIISDLWKTPKYLWLVMDMLNVLQGVLIFVIFVCKESVWLALRKRFHTVRFRTSNHRLLSSVSKSPKSSSASKATAHLVVQKIPSSDSKHSSTITQTETLDLISERDVIYAEKIGMD